MQVTPPSTSHCQKRKIYYLKADTQNVKDVLRSYTSN